MGYQPHYIASFEDDSGLFTYYEPFLAPEKAFPVLENAWCFRGKVIRKQGYSLLARLERDLSKADAGNVSAAGAGTTNYNLFTLLLLDTTEPYASIVPKTLVLTIGAPISTTLTDVAGTGALVCSPVTTISAATVNYATGVVSITYTGAASASDMTVTMSYYPGLPVTGLCTQETAAINQEHTVAFDTKYAYSYQYLSKRFAELCPGTTWQGASNNLFWSCNYWQNTNGKLFWASNNNIGTTKDPLRYYDTVAWNTFTPAIDGTNSLWNASCFLPFKGRLVMFSTWEGATASTISAAVNYPQRIRWSAVGSPLATNAFRSDIVGQGGYLDMPTSEVITSVEFIKDTMLVKCEGSSWKLIYTGNEVLPFVVQRINTELGAESKMSLVPFDAGVYSVGNYGITTDDSNNVERIDLQIPELLFKFSNSNNGVDRVCGIRDYYQESVYWCYPDSTTQAVYPDRVLIYNYRNNTYATFTDSFTCFGYFQSTGDATWAELNRTWAQADEPWSSPTPSAFFPYVIAGTQHGFVEQVMQQGVNDASLYIAAINFTTGAFKIPSHNLQSGDIVYITGVIGGSGGIDPAALNGKSYLVTVLTSDTVSLSPYISGKFTDILSAGLASTSSIYLGGGLVAKWNNFNITTKRFSPFYEAGTQCRLGYVDFFLTKTQSGQFSSDVYVNEDSATSMTDISDVQNGTNVVLTCPENTTLIPFQQQQGKIWHRQTVGSVCQNFQVTMSLTPEQNADSAINAQDFQLHAMTLYLSANARMTQ